MQLKSVYKHVQFYNKASHYIYFTIYQYNKRPRIAINCVKSDWSFDFSDIDISMFAQKMYIPYFARENIAKVE